MKNTNIIEVVLVESNTAFYFLYDDLSQSTIQETKKKGLRLLINLEKRGYIDKHQYDKVFSQIAGFVNVPIDEDALDFLKNKKEQSLLKKINFN